MTRAAPPSPDSESSAASSAQAPRALELRPLLSVPPCNPPCCSPRAQAISPARRGAEGGTWAREGKKPPATGMPRPGSRDGAHPRRHAPSRDRGTCERFSRDRGACVWTNKEAGAGRLGAARGKGTWDSSGGCWNPVRGFNAGRSPISAGSQARARVRCWGQHEVPGHGW